MASKNSQEKIFYNYFNPIYEDIDESGLVEENYEYEDEDEQQWREINNLTNPANFQSSSPYQMVSQIPIVQPQPKKPFFKEGEMGTVFQNKIISNGIAKVSGAKHEAKKSELINIAKLQKSLNRHIPFSAESKYFRFNSGNDIQMGNHPANLHQSSHENVLMSS